MKITSTPFSLLVLISALLIVSIPLHGQECFDADFESGTLGGYTSYHGKINGDGVVVFPFQNIDNTQHRIMKVSDGYDPIANLLCIENKNLLVTGAGTGKFTLRLGDAVNGYRTSRIVMSFDVTPDVSFFLLKYAVVIQDPQHEYDAQPRFELNIKDQDGNILDCGEYKVRAAPDNPGFESCGDWRVRPWTTAGFELESYIGQTIAIEIFTTDCGHGAHGGYAYIDATCSPIELDLQSYCPGSGYARYVVTEGFESYLWNTGETTRVLDIDNPVAGQEYQVTVTSSTGCTLVLKDTLPEIPLLDDLEPSFFDGPDSLRVCFGAEIIYQPSGTNIGEVMALELGYTAETFYIFAEESQTINFVTSDNLGCAYDTTQLVLTVDNIDIDFDITPPCDGEPNGELTIDNLGDTTLMTSFQNSNFTYTYQYENLLPGEYVLNITNSTGCVFAKNIIIIAKEPPELYTRDIKPATCGEQNGSISVSSFSPLVYSFNDGDFGTQTNWTNLAGGTYTLAYKDPDEGCLATEIIVLDTYGPPVLGVISSDSTFCGEHNGEITATTTDGYPPLEYSINESSFMEGNIFTDLAPESYTLIVRDADNCRDTTGVTLFAAPYAQIDSIVPSPAYCNEDNGSLHITVFNSSIPHLVYIDSIAMEHNPVQDLASGNYQIVLVDHHGCSDTLQSYVEFIKAPTIDSITYSPTPCGEQRASITLHGTALNDSILYSINENLFHNENTYALQSGEHILAIKDEMGCIVDTLLIVANEERFLLANIFSPNADGVNDEFCFQPEHGVDALLNFQIFDRWGNKVFNYADKNALVNNLCWDGRCGGRDVEEGVYVYYFQARLSDQRLLCKYGDVTVVR